MRLKSGDQVKNIILPGLDGSEFNLETLKGKPYLLSFYRFASCPFCNLRIHELLRQFDEFSDDFTMVAVFDSSRKVLLRDVGNQDTPFPFLADGDRQYYRAYGIKRSLFGFLVGLIGRFPTLMKSMFMGYLPKEFKSSLLTMPADFLVDAEGVIQTAYYGKDEGDHLPIEEIKVFSHSSLTKQ